MSVRRIVLDIATPDPTLAQQFYGELLGLDVLMDFGWITTYGGKKPAKVQINFASQGGSDQPVPDMSIEVDDVFAIWARAQDMGLDCPYPLVTEPWGVTRFFVRDPFGKLVNILSHEG